MPMLHNIPYAYVSNNDNVINNANKKVNKDFNVSILWFSYIFYFELWWFSSK